MKIAVTILLALTLVQTGCGDGKDVIVRSEVKRQLLDPDSAKFRNVHVFENGNYCGEVNAKNAHGGYSGYVVFYRQKGQTYLTKSGDGLNLICRWAESPLLQICDVEKLKIKEDDAESLAKLNALGCPELTKKSSFKED